MLKATLHGLLAHKLRLALAAIAVVLGVSFVTGTIVLGDTITKTFDDLFTTTTAGVDLNVRGVNTGVGDNSADHPPIPDTVQATVQGVDGVKEAFGYIQRVGVTLVGRDGNAITTGGAPALGVLWNPYPDLAALHLKAGSAPSGDGQVVIDAKSATDHGFKPGDHITVVLPSSGPRALTVSGVAGFGTQDNLAGATIAAFDPVAGRALLGSPHEFEGINIKAADGVSQAELQSRVARVLPAGVEVVTGQTLANEQSDAIKKNISVLTTILLAFAFVAVFVGSFIILNTFSILVAQRQRELALLRALGATRAQVLRDVVLEAFITGVIASVAGVGLGVLVAKGLEALFSAIGLDLGTTPLQVGPKAVLVGLGVGTVVTLVASLVPARRATKVSPVEALRESTPAPSALSLGRIASGLGLLAVGVGTLMVGLFAVSSNQLLLTGVGALLTFVGVAVLAPVVVPPVVVVIGLPVARVIGVPGRLARENARRNPRRTASTASALMIGVGLVTTFTVVAASFKDSINGLVDRTVTADYVVSPDTQSGAQGLPPTVADRVAHVAQAAVVSPISGGAFTHDRKGDQVAAVDPATIAAVGVFTVKQGAPLSALGEGDVAISEDAATSQPLKVGDVLPMQFERPGVHRQRVATVYARNPLFGDYLVTRSLWTSANTQTQDFVILVKGASGVSTAELRSAIKAAVTGYPGVKVQNNAEYKQAQGAQLDQLLNIMNVLVAFAIVIALLGVVNTMALSIVERTRELGLVRALGMTRSQTRSMVRWETVLITLLGALLGVTVGVFFGWALARAFASSGLDGLNFAPGRLAIYLVVAFVAGILAAIFPARRASRVDLLKAIATE